MAINAHFCQFSSSASFSLVFFVYLFLLSLLLLLRLLLLLLILLLLLLNDQIANLFGAFILFKVNNSVFSYVNKNFGNDPLFCCVIHELRPKGRGRIKNVLPHKTKQSSLPWNKVRNGKKSAFFFVSFRPLLLFLPCILCIFFFFFFVLLLPLILLLLLLLLNDQIANFLGAFTLFQGKELFFFYVVKSFWYALILLRHTWVKTERKGSYQKLFTT